MHPKKPRIENQILVVSLIEVNFAVLATRLF